MRESRFSDTKGVVYLEISALGQVFIFLGTICGGIIIGFVFDIFRIFRKLTKSSTKSVFIQDIIFFIILPLLIFGTIFYTNDGEARWYEFLGIIIGTILYMLTLSHYVILVSVKVIEVITKIIVFLLRIILFPIVFIYKVLNKPTHFIIIRIGYIRRAIKRATGTLIGSIARPFGNLKKISKKI